MATKDNDSERGHKARFFISLFKAQGQAKLSDEQLAAAAEKVYPGQRDWLRNMGSIRAHYNKGGFTGQEGAPANPVPRFVKGEPVKRGALKGACTKQVVKPRGVVAQKLKTAAASKPPAKLKVTLKKSGEPAPAPTED